MFPIELSVAEGILTVIPYGGVPGRRYTYRFEIETDAGFIYVETVQQGTLPGLSSFPIPPAADPGYGAPLMWHCQNNNFGPAKNLPPYNVTKKERTSDAGRGADPGDCADQCRFRCYVMIGVLTGKWAYYEPVFLNRTGGVVTLYPYSGDQFESLGANAGTTIQNDQSVTLWVAQSAPSSCVLLPVSREDSMKNLKIAAPAGPRRAEQRRCNWSMMAIRSSTMERAVAQAHRPGGNSGRARSVATGVYVTGSAVGGGLAVPNSCVIGGTGTALATAAGHEFGDECNTERDRGGTPGGSSGPHPDQQQRQFRRPVHHGQR